MADGSALIGQFVGRLVFVSHLPGTVVEPERREGVGRLGNDGADGQEEKSFDGSAHTLL